jgi:hypothetical protein
LVLGATVITVLFFFLLPRVVEDHVGVVFRVGPDAIGQLNAVDALLTNGSYQDLNEEILSATSAQNPDDLFNQSQPLVLESLSKSLSIKSEFIIGSLRIGYAGLTASLVSPFSRTYLPTAMYSVAALSLISTGLLLNHLIKRHVRSFVLATILALMSLINVNLLHAFHEGGVSQGFAVVALATLFFAFATPGLDRFQVAALVAICGVVTLTSYQDLFYVVIGFLIGLTIVAIFFRRSDLMQRIKVSWITVAATLVGLLPLTVRSIGALVRRAGDAGQGGWSVMRWPDAFSIYGLINVYKDSMAKTDELRSVVDGLMKSLFPSLELEIIAFLPVVVITIARSRSHRRFRDSGEIILLSILTGLGIVLSYFLLKYSGNGSNYVFVKLVAALAPFLPLLTIGLVQRRFLENSRSGSQLALLALYVMLVGYSSINYVSEYRRESLKVSQEDIRGLSSPLSRSVLSRYALVGPYRWDSVALTPFWPASIVRGAERDVEVYVPEDLEIALLVRKDQCPDWKCLSRMDQQRVIKLSPSFRVIPLDLSTSVLRRVGYSGKVLIVRGQVKQLHGPVIDGDFSIRP